MRGSVRFWLVVLALLGMGVCSVGCDGGGDDKKAVDDVVTVDQDSCTPTCSGKECGPDGCGGYCGSCAAGTGCNGAGQCQPLDACTIEHAIVCGGKVSGNTEEYENDLDYYACQGYLGGGGEVGYVFNATSDDHIVVTLEAPMGDLDLVVTQGKCKPDTCLAYGKDMVDIDVTANKSYYLMVEAQEGVSGPFTLTVDCHSDCTPECTGKECGSDGCGGLCGECPVAAPFCAEGSCAVACVPDCAGNKCGDDGCGGNCGACPIGWGCIDAVCEPLPEPPDGCEALSGPGCEDCFCEICVCSILPECCAIEWNAKCANMCHSGDCDACPEEGSFGWACESDDDCLSQLCIEGLQGNKVCSTFCVDSCPAGWSCVFNPDIYHTKFCSTECYADCGGKECGGDGCGGSCGECSGDHSCVDGKCEVGSVVSGACTNDADMGAIIMASETIYDQAMFCGLTCEGSANCASDCIQEGAGLSGACASCFGAMGVCAATNCMEDCLGGFQNSDCAKCAEANGCAGEFGTCTGFD
jgi:hypothetical protein